MITRPILLVEDEPNDVFFVQHALELASVTNVVQVASDGQEAIDYLGGVGRFADRSKYPLPYLVLLDLKLPRVMGLDVLKWIRERKELAVIVIILTSSRQHEDLATAYRLGVNAYLVKSPDLSSLKEMANAIKDFWLIHNFPPPQPFSAAEMISAFATTANLGSASTL